MTTTFLATNSSDWSDPTNWDNGTPSSADDAIVNVNPSSGAITCNNLIAGTITTINAWSTASFTANQIQGFTYNDPGVSFVFASALNCTFLTFPNLITFTDAGGCTFSGGAWTGTVSIAGSSTITGSDFSGATLTLGSGVTISGGSFPSAVTLRNATVSGGTWTSTTVTFIGSVNFAPTLGAGTDGGITSIIAYSGSGTITLSTPSMDNVLSTAGGNWVPPDISQVLKPSAGGPNPGYGVSNALVGTATMGGASSLINGGLVH